MLAFGPIGSMPLGDAGASAPGSTVTGVTVLPTTANASATFSAIVAGTGSPSQAVTWAASAGSITNSGVFTAPSQTGSTQTITITATSLQDSTVSGTATVTIAASASVPATKITLALENRNAVLKTNLTGLRWAVFANVSPDLFVAPIAKGATGVTDASGVLSVNITGLGIPVGTTLALAIYKGDGTSTDPAQIGFIGPVVAS